MAISTPAGSPPASRIRPTASRTAVPAGLVGAAFLLVGATGAAERPLLEIHDGDRVAFLRMASGHFKRGMKLTHVRSKKPMAISNPVLFLASDRELAEEAWAGDIIGIPNHGQLRIGDTLTEGETLRFAGIPSFAPELLQSVRAGDPMKAKHLDKALNTDPGNGQYRKLLPKVIRKNEEIIAYFEVLQKLAKAPGAGTRLRMLVAHSLLGLGGETTDDTRRRIDAHGAISDAEIVEALVKGQELSLGVL